MERGREVMGANAFGAYAPGHEFHGNQWTVIHRSTNFSLGKKGDIVSRDASGAPVKFDSKEEAEKHANVLRERRASQTGSGREQSSHIVVSPHSDPSWFRKNSDGTFRVDTI